MMKEYTYILMRVSLAVFLFWLMSGQDLPQHLASEGPGVEQCAVFIILMESWLGAGSRINPYE